MRQRLVVWMVMMGMCGLYLPAGVNAEGPVGTEEVPLSGCQPNELVLIQETVPLTVAQDLAENGQPLTHEQQVAAAAMSQPPPQDPPKEDGKDGEDKPATVPPEIKDLVDALLAYPGGFAVITGTGIADGQEMVLISMNGAMSQNNPSLKNDMNSAIKDAIAGSDLKPLAKGSMLIAMYNISNALYGLLKANPGGKIVVVIDAAKGTATFVNEAGDILQVVVIGSAAAGNVVKVFPDGIPGFPVVPLTPPGRVGDFVGPDVHDIS